jgi:selenium metabolism protein YedF
MSQKTVIIQGESLGRGDEQLGRILMANFLRLLAESGKKPATIILWNAGIRLACEGSDVLEHLKRLEKQGVEILACTTCLEYFELRDKILVGKPTTMSKSIAAMMETDVVTL